MRTSMLWSGRLSLASRTQLAGYAAVVAVDPREIMVGSV